MFIKDFDHFADRRKIRFGHEYFETMLPFLEGDAWKALRSKISPAFSSAKLKGMHKIISEVGNDFTEHVERISTNNSEINVKHLASRYFLQIAALTSIGVEILAFDDDKAGHIFQAIMNVTSRDSSPLQTLKGIITVAFPKLAELLNVEIFDRKSVNFIGDMIEQTVKIRKEKTGGNRRNDIVDLLLEAFEGNEQDKDQSKSENLLPTKKGHTIPINNAHASLISNIFIMFMAGIATNPTFFSVCLYFLAMNPCMQDKLFNMIKDAVNIGNGDCGDELLDYSTITSMPYLDMFIREALRHYPIGEIERVCVKEYTVPGTNCTIPKGMVVQIPNFGMMMDEKYFPNPTIFNPDHFAVENKRNRDKSAFLAFGIGPRNCVGKSIALLQLKIGIVYLVYKFKLMSCDKTTPRLEVDPNQRSFITLPEPKGGVWVRFEKRNRN